MIENLGFIREDFAGPGGWDTGARWAGLHIDVGIEYESKNTRAVETARAAGHTRWNIDVTSDAVRDYRWPRLWGYIASPPCQTFSMAGKGSGREHLEHLLKALRLVAEGARPEEAIALVTDAALDVRSVLVLEPLYVIRQHRPTWIAMEQVPAVLPIWEAYAEILREWGYSVETGILNAEQYGVPQTRRRAILVAHSEREARLPTPTHSRFYPRDPSRLDGGVLPWLSMARALGWDEAELVGFPRKSDGQGEVFLNGQAYRARDLRPAAVLAHTVTEKLRSWTRLPDRVPNGGDPTWAQGRPSPTIVGSFAPDVVAKPAYRKAGDTPRQKAPGSIRVTVEEAGLLQSFPASYPWKGNKGERFQQVGDAVPPLLARAILSTLLGDPDPTSPRPAS